MKIKPLTAVYVAMCSTNDRFLCFIFIQCNFWTFFGQKQLTDKHEKTKRQKPPLLILTCLITAHRGSPFSASDCAAPSLHFASGSFPSWRISRRKRHRARHVKFYSTWSGWAAWSWYQLLLHSWIQSLPSTNRLPHVAFQATVPILLRACMELCRTSASLKGAGVFVVRSAERPLAPCNAKMRSLKTRVAQCPRAFLAGWRVTI